MKRFVNQGLIMTGGEARIANLAIGDHARAIAHSVDAERAGDRDTEERPPLKVLLLAANPVIPNVLHLALDEEARAIEVALRTSPGAERIVLKTSWAVRPGDLQELLLRERPAILHFCGHGKEQEGIALHGGAPGHHHVIAGSTLKTLLSILGGAPRIALLNACYSEDQGKELVEVVDFVVCYRYGVDDPAATAFAAAFYRALAFGRSIRAAFELAVNALDLEGLRGERTVPVLLARAGASAEEVLVGEA